MNDGNNDQPTRDARGRWLKGHCPNPKGRPRKSAQSDYDPGDLRDFGSTLIEVNVSGQRTLMDRRAALLRKMFEDAMKGKVSVQRFLYREFERNDERLAAAQFRYEELMTEWVIENPDFNAQNPHSCGLLFACPSVIHIKADLPPAAMKGGSGCRS